MRQQTFPEVEGLLVAALPTATCQHVDVAQVTAWNRRSLTLQPSSRGLCTTLCPLPNSPNPLSALWGFALQHAYSDWVVSLSFYLSCNIVDLFNDLAHWIVMHRLVSAAGQMEVYGRTDPCRPTAHVGFQNMFMQWEGSFSEERTLSIKKTWQKFC